MPAWVAFPNAPAAAGRLDDLQKEWAEARAVVDRLDGTLVDLRKYGFGLASGLLTANGVIFGLASGGHVSPDVVGVAVAITMLLAAVLFVVDQYYHMIQWGATNRATALESALNLSLSREILRWASWVGPKLPRVAPRGKRGGLFLTESEITGYLSLGAVWMTRFIWRYLAPIQYGSFLLIGAALGIALMGSKAIPAPQHAAADFMWIVFVFSVVLILMVRWLAGRERKALSHQPLRITSAIRVVTVELRSAPKVAREKEVRVELNLVKGEPDLPQGASALAVVKPTVQGRLAIVGCSVESKRVVQITFTNADARPVRPTPGELYQVFVY